MRLFPKVPHQPAANDEKVIPRVIEVADVEPATSPLPEVRGDRAVDTLLNPWSPPTSALPSTAIEACSLGDDSVVGGVVLHAGLAAIHLAFNDHRPLVLSPDIFWMFVVQGFANHVNADPEGLRRKFVAHEGKLTLAVRRDDFIKGSPRNAWPEVFESFTTQIGEHIGKETLSLLLPTFSTSGPAERAAAQVVLLDAMQSYFDYRVQSLCGIPRITLLGTVADWRRLAARTSALGRFGLTWWTEQLAPILAELVAAAGGRANPSFWRSLYKIHHGSGGSSISGWITAFFPYLKDRKSGQLTLRNAWLEASGERLQRLLYPDEQSGSIGGPTTDLFSSGLAKAPFVWEFIGARSSMEFVGGFVGVRQDPETLALRPAIGWAIHDPSQSAALIAARVEEKKRFDDEQSRLAAVRARRWNVKGMCPACGRWIYFCIDDEVGGHCGTPLVNIVKRLPGRPW